MMRRIFAGLLLTLAAGCGSAEPVAEDTTQHVAVSREQFVEVMVELREAGRRAATTEAFEAERREILDRHGITTAMLLDFARTRDAEVNELAAVWESIEAAISEAATEDSAASR